LVAGRGYAEKISSFYVYEENVPKKAAVSMYMKDKDKEV
jgi:hypothetical protein